MEYEFIIQVKFNPPKLRYRRPHNRPFKINHYATSKNSIKLIYGNIGIQVLEAGWLTQNHIEATRLVLKRKLHKEDEIFIRASPTRGITGRSLGIRMGKGKGLIDFWVFPVHKGRIVFELKLIKSQPTMALPTSLKQILKIAIQKLPMKCKIVYQNFLI